MMNQQDKDDDNDATEATLQVTLLSIETLTKIHHTLSKSQPFAVAWIRPSLKQSTKTLTLPNKLHFPLSSLTLCDPSVSLTIELHCPRLTAAAKLVGAASLPLPSLLCFAGEIVTLEIRKPSGRICGSVRMASRVMWCLDCRPSSVVEPTAPLLPELVGGFDKDVHMDEMVKPTAPEMSDSVGAGGLEVGNGVFECVDWELEEKKVRTGEMMVDKVEKMVVDKVGREGGKGAWRNFLVGLVSGAVAVVFVGVVGFSDG